MNASDERTIAAIKNCLEAGIATPSEALLAAYRLGKTQGGIEMAAAGQVQLAELLRKAA